jgi:Leucine-rich repeat (LRR) protein
MSNKSRICSKSRLCSNVFTEILTTVPVEDWYRNWPADRTIMLSMTSKKIRNIINKMNIPAIVHWKWKFWSEPLNGSTEVKLKIIMTQLKQITYLYKITTLILRRCDIQINIEEFIKVIKNCPMLEKLDLQRNNINTEGAIMIAKGLRKCHKLLHIDLYINKIGNKGAIKITKLLKYCPQLSYLNLSFNMIYDKGIKKLVKIIIESGHLALNDIELCYNRIEEDGVISLVKMLIKCPNIKYLNLSYNTIKFNEAIIIAKRYNIDLCSYDKIRTISYP